VTYREFSSIWYTSIKGFDKIEEANKWVKDMLLEHFDVVSVFYQFIG
jgi:hypothetical protein